MDEDNMLTSGYLVLLGAMMAVIGIMEIILDISGGSFETSLVVMDGGETGDFMLWRGLVLLSGGAMIVSGATGLEHLKGLGKAVLGTFMLWMVALVNLFALLSGALLADEESTRLFVTNVGDLLAGMEGPFIPSILLLPFTVPVAYLAYVEWKRGREPTEENLLTSMEKRGTA